MKVNLLLPWLAAALPLCAETVILTTVPEENRHLEPLVSLGGVPLAAGAQVKLGGFPGMSDDALLDAAAAGTAIAAFVSFGAPASVGQGVDGAAGGFEVSFRDVDAAGLVGEAVSLIVDVGDGEWLIARFPDEVFSPKSDTGVEPLRTLHFVEAKLIVGNRTGDALFSSAPLPEAGGFQSWIATFPAITDPALRDPMADADGDGQSNFLEYATGGNPAAAGDAPVCEIRSDGAGGFWVRFRRVPGLGAVRYTPQWSAELSQAWSDAASQVSPDPADPSWLRLHVAEPYPALGFFRLLVE